MRRLGRTQQMQCTAVQLKAQISQQAAAQLTVHASQQQLPTQSCQQAQRQSASQDRRITPRDSGQCLDTLLTAGIVVVTLKK